MKVIGASLESTYELTLHYEVNNNEVKVSFLEVTGIFIPELKCRLFVPQDTFMEIQRLKNSEGYFAVTWNKSILNLSYQVHITINYE